MSINETFSVNLSCVFALLTASDCEEMVANERVCPDNTAPSGKQHAALIFSVENDPTLSLLERKRLHPVWLSGCNGVRLPLCDSRAQSWEALWLPLGAANRAQAHSAPNDVMM